jgi:hypothetical protein
LRGCVVWWCGSQPSGKCHHVKIDVICCWVGWMSQIRSPSGLFFYFSFFLFPLSFVIFRFHIPGTGRIRVGSKVWFDECIRVKGDIIIHIIHIINIIIEGICCLVMWFTTVGQVSPCENWRDMLLGRLDVPSAIGVWPVCIF